MRPDRVWYVAYGSNVNETRFLRYLVGDDDHVGARDATPPAGFTWAVAPMHLRFSGESVRWNGGGVAFVDLDPSGSAIVRAWDITAEQFEDVFAQENGRPVGSDLDWHTLRSGPTVVGPSWYGQIVPLDLEFATHERPALTFTWSEQRPLNPPHADYRNTIEAGLAEHPELSSHSIAQYLKASICTT